VSWKGEKKGASTVLVCCSSKRKRRKSITCTLRKETREGSAPASSKKREGWGCEGKTGSKGKKKEALKVSTIFKMLFQLRWKRIGRETKKMCEKGKKSDSRQWGRERLKRTKAGQGTFAALLRFVIKKGEKASFKH